MGGIIAWEMTRQMAWKSETIGVLALFDAYPPVQGMQTPARTDDVGMLFRFAADLHRATGKDFNEFSERYAQLDAQGKWTLVLEMMKRDGLLTQNNAEEALAQMVNIFTRNSLAMESYIMQKSAQDILLFRAAETVDREQDQGGWTQWTSGKIKLHVISGDHYSILRQPAVSKIAEILNSQLQNARENTRLAASVD